MRASRQLPRLFLFSVVFFAFVLLVNARQCAPPTRCPICSVLSFFRHAMAASWGARPHTCSDTACGQRSTAQRRGCEWEQRQQQHRLSAQHPPAAGGMRAGAHVHGWRARHGCVRPWAAPAPAHLHVPQPVDAARRRVGQVGVADVQLPEPERVRLGQDVEERGVEGRAAQGQGREGGAPLDHRAREGPRVGLAVQAELLRVCVRVCVLKCVRVCACVGCFWATDAASQSRLNSWGE